MLQARCYNSSIVVVLYYTRGDSLDPAPTIRAQPSHQTPPTLVHVLISIQAGILCEQPYCNAPSELTPPNTPPPKVLISIQALVLCEQPYYNEAGYERQLGTSDGAHHARRSEPIHYTVPHRTILRSLLLYYFLTPHSCTTRARCSTTLRSSLLYYYTTIPLYYSISSSVQVQRGRATL